jgi:hypothetical protein
MKSLPVFKRLCDFPGARIDRLQRLRDCPKDIDDENPEGDERQI